MKIQTFTMVAMTVALPTSSFAQEAIGTAQSPGGDSLSSEKGFLEKEFSSDASSFLARPPDELPGSVWTFRVDQDLRMRASSVVDVLEMSVPGLFVARSVTGNPIFAQRGQNPDFNTKTVVMWNTNSVTRRYQYGGGQGLQLPLLGDIATIQVQNGPGSLASAAGAMAGALRLTPRSGGDYPGLQVQIHGDTKAKGIAAELGFGGAYDGGDYFIYAGGFRADGFVPDDLSTRKTTQAKIDVVPLSGRSTLNWNHGRLNVMAQFSQMRNAKADINDVIFPSRADGWLYRHLMMSAKYDVVLSDAHSLSLNVVGLAQEEGPMNLSEGSLLPFNTQDSVSAAKASREQSYFAQAMYRFVHKNYSLVAGGRFGGRRFSEASRNGSMLFFADDPYTSGAWADGALFAEGLADFGSFVVGAGVRNDWVRLLGGHFLSTRTYERLVKQAVYDAYPQTSQSALSPRFSLVYRVSELTKAKFVYNAGFRAPDMYSYEQNARLNADFQGAGQRPPLQIDPEVLHNMEVSLNSQLSNYVSGQVAAYGGRLYNYIVEAEGSRNITDPWQIWGLEARLQFVDEDFFRSDISYAFSAPFGVSQNAIDTTELVDRVGTTWRVYHPQIVKLNAQVRPFSSLNLQIGGFLGWYQPLPTWSSRKIQAENKGIHWYEGIRARQRVVGHLWIGYADQVGPLSCFANLRAQNLIKPNVPFASSLPGLPEATAFGSIDRRILLEVGFSY